jgi:uncharacterized protein (TIGR02145 family)
MNTKNRIYLYPLLLMGVLFMPISSCKKDKNKGIITDIDGNMYNSVTIGSQIWMKENLKTIHYRNGDPIPNVSDTTQWYNITTGAYCDYGNMPENSTNYGRLYNWDAVQDNRNLCPSGWHIPADIEWSLLTNYLRGDSIAGGKLKEAGTANWQSPNTGATNSSGFTALPRGNRSYDGIYHGIGTFGNWWSSTEYNIGNGWGRSMEYNSTKIIRDPISVYNGCSVRCIQD